MYRRSLHFHFVGIGGSGMSGLAEVLLSLGFVVSGSDQRESEVVAYLRSCGASIAIGHDARNLPQSASLLVYSSAVPPTNPEVTEARRRGLPVIRRAEVLAELMRLKFGVAVAGSHGKTSTTSMTAAVLLHGGLDPTVVIGGQLRDSSTGARVGRSEYLVAETDESDRSFLLLKPTIAIVTNIDAEHLSAYASLTDLEDAFQQFVEAVPFYGLAVLCIDDPRVRDLASKMTRRVVTFGFSPDADLQPREVEASQGQMIFEPWYKGERLGRVTLAVPGRHMVSNSLAAIAVGLEFGLSPAAVCEGLSSFRGVKRRLEVVGRSGGALIVSDYGHHPAEIRATIRAFREGYREECQRLRVIFQPHRYSRTRDCFAEFLDAFEGVDELFVSDIYPAGEAPLEGITAERLVAALRTPAHYLPSLDEALVTVAASTKPGDVVIWLGAGPIGAYPSRMVRLLEQASPRSGVLSV